MKDYWNHMFALFSGMRGDRSYSPMGGYNGNRLRAIRAEKGVGRPPAVIRARRMGYN